jgi:Flp pilus assembly protein TadG
LKIWLKDAWAMSDSAIAALRRLMADRRGATALVFALGAMGLLGLVGLATEGGTWYLEKRHGQNAADAAVTSGVLALANGQNVTTSAATAAALTGYASGVAITTGIFTISTGSFVADATSAANAVKAVVTTTRAPLFSSLFRGSSQVTISESAVAMMAATAPVCMLAGAGGLSFGGSTSVHATGCTLASNKTGPNSIIGAAAPAHVDVGQSLISEGGCSGCTGLTTPPLTYQPPTPDPFASTIGALSMPNTTGTQCNNSNSTPVPYNSTTPPTINCNGLKMTGAPIVDLLPGTYFFYNSSLTLNNGILECTTCTGVGASGVTIIMTGSTAANVGTIDINGNVTVHLVAPATNSFNAAFNGVLFYTDQKAAVGNVVKLTGTDTSTFGGAMYFPSSAVKFIGNTGVGLPTCSEIVGWSLELTGNSSVNIAGCPVQNVPMAQAVRLVQ